MTRIDLLRKLREHHACADAIEWIESNEHATLQEAWDSCDCADWMLWLLARLHPVDQRGPIRHAMCDCAETALRFVPAGEDRPARAIEAARMYADGQATGKELAAAAVAARDAAWAVARDAAPSAVGAAARATVAAAEYGGWMSALIPPYAPTAWAAAWYAADAAAIASDRVLRDAMVAATHDATWGAKEYAAWDAARYAARGAALKDMAALIRKRVPNPEVI